MKQLSAFAAALLAGCGVLPHDILPEPVSPDKYRLYSCEQLELESARVAARAEELATHLEAFAREDPPRNGLPLWPEYARFKGEHAALQKAALNRNCAIARRVPVHLPTRGESSPQ